MQIILRDEAIKLGLKKNYTGKPCPKGHVTDRWVSNKSCHSCHAVYRKIKERRNRKKIGSQVRFARLQSVKARKRKIKCGNLTQQDINAMFIEQSGNCFYCSINIKDGWDIEHKIPLCRQGQHIRSNIVLSCKPCNSSKGIKIYPHEWNGHGREAV